MLHCAAACPWCCCRAARVMSPPSCCTSHVPAVMLHESRPRRHAARVVSPPLCCMSHITAIVLHESCCHHCAARVTSPPSRSHPSCCGLSCHGALLPVVSLLLVCVMSLPSVVSPPSQCRPLRHHHVCCPSRRHSENKK